MIKGLGVFTFCVFLGVASQIGEFGPGFAIWFLSLLLVVSGVCSFAFLLYPESLTDDAVKKIFKTNLPSQNIQLIKSVENAAAVIRKDGLLASEGLRKEADDPWLKYALKKMMDGFEKNLVIHAVRNEHLRYHEQFFTIEKYKEKIAGVMTLVGLVGSLCHIMYFLKNDTGFISVSFVPFLISILMQIIFSAVAQNKIDQLMDQSRLYYAILENGISGIYDGVNSEILRDQLLVRVGDKKWEL